MDLGLVATEKLFEAVRELVLFLVPRTNLSLSVKNSRRPAIVCVVYRRYCVDWDNRSESKSKDTRTNKFVRGTKSQQTILLANCWKAASGCTWHP
jgi:hypothetical protein